MKLNPCSFVHFEPFSESKRRTIAYYYLFSLCLQWRPKFGQIVTFSFVFKSYGWANLSNWLLPLFSTFYNILLFSESHISSLVHQHISTKYECLPVRLLGSECCLLLWLFTLCFPITLTLVCSVTYDCSVVQIGRFSRPFYLPQTGNMYCITLCMFLLFNNIL